MCSDPLAPSSSRAIRKPSALAVILLLSLVLNLTGIWWGLPQTGTWAPDEIRPSRVHEAMSSLFSRGWHGWYPLFHHILLMPPVLLFSLLHDAGMLRLTPAAGASILLLLFRLLSTAMAAGLVYGIFRIGQKLAGRRAGLFAAAAAALIVPMPYYAKTANLEVPYLFWFVASVHFLVRALEDGRRGDLVLLGVTAALAVCTKDQAWALYVFVPFVVLWNDIKRSRLRSAIPSYGWAVAAAAGTFAAANNLVFNWSGFISHVRLINNLGGPDFAAFPATLPGQLRLLFLTSRQLLFCLGWPLLLVCLAGLALVLIGRKSSFAFKALPLLVLSYHLFFIAVVRHSFDRFLLPAAVLLAVFGGAALDRFLGSEKRAWKAAAVAALFGFGFFRAVSVDRLLLADSRYAAERWIREHIPPSAAIGTATDPIYLPRLGRYAVSDLPLSLDEFRDAPKPEYIVFCAASRGSSGPESAAALFFAGFDAVPPGYRRVHEVETRLSCLPLSFEGINTNLASIGQKIEIFARKDIPDPAAGSGRGR